ncbi:GNAT family N-acetyltransferase [Cohnella sp. AR92]|uniref:GNAT family N-acetyltransferase n=1 Tax=Cohnella sp. AR92 TaxID=648716 RepID=UPI000F8DA31D|nr:GNAT family N-acetyltransferase [Cohnella sp. AR92]RUS45885.1 GNAT family N-acetyltransferase [Cohnella sp. AR92]
MLEIKPITREKLKELCELYDELIGRKTNFGKMAEIFGKIVENPGYHLLGAYLENELVGSLMGIECQDLVGECKPFMVIENVIVSNRARRQGVGRRLMEAIEGVAKERDCYYIIFVSGGQRKEAHAFYEKLGFKDEQVEGFRKHL